MNVLLCMGPAPDPVKLAPVYRALTGTSVRPLVVHAEPADEEAARRLAFFEMEPDLRLDRRRERPSAAHRHALQMDQLDAFLSRTPVDAMLIHGHTPAALATALTAFHHAVPLGHLEDVFLPASDDLVARQHLALIRQVAAWHFAPSPLVSRAIKAAGCNEQEIYYVGNPILDAARWGQQRMLAHLARQSADDARLQPELLRRLQDGRLLLVAADPSAPDAPSFAALASVLRRLAETHEQMHVVWPFAPNRQTRKEARSAFSGMDAAVRRRLLLREPVDYPQMLWLLKHAALVLTDASFREEAAALKKPLLLLSELPSEPEAVEEVLAKRIAAHWGDAAARDALIAARPLYGNGHAGAFIAYIILRQLTGSQSGIAPPIPSLTVAA